MKIIALEEHYHTHAIEKAVGKLDVPTWPSKTLQDAYHSGFLSGERFLRYRMATACL